TPNYVALKIFTRQSVAAGTHEAKIYEHINKTESNHPGRKYVRKCIDTFECEGPNGMHKCLVHPPLWKSIWSLLRSGDEHRLPEPLLKTVVGCLLRALDYLHSECHLVHTGMKDVSQVGLALDSEANNYPDFKAANIMLGLDDQSVLKAFEKDEIADPSPRNIYADRTIYKSRTIAIPKQAAIGFPVLCDFGLAQFEGGTGDDDAQPAVYRAPEIILDMDWSYSIDIWNTGVMV
ncbi:hypothetical protein DV736_g6715, partial [Chaetothyriales sp. CBS 134916]